MTDPVTFGYKSAWLAVRSTGTDDVVRALGLRGARSASPGEGITRAREADHDVFVAAPVDGWTLCVGSGLTKLADESMPAELARLSKELRCEVQFFCTHRVVGVHGWGRAVRGEATRAYLYVGESDETVLDVGAATAEERALGFFVAPHRSDPRADPDDEWTPDEQDVMRLAGRWSLDPLTLAMTGQGRLGSVGKPWWMFW